MWKTHVFIRGMYKFSLVFFIKITNRFKLVFGSELTYMQNDRNPLVTTFH